MSEHVYEPAEDSFLLGENLKLLKNDNVLDMGTGCGILAIIVAKEAKSVLAVDINPFALSCAIKNAESNFVKEKINFLRGDLFQPIVPCKKFNLIIFNSPYLPSEPEEEKSWIEKSWAGGRNGRKVIDRFINEAPSFLSNKGRILLIQSSLSDENRTLDIFNQRNMKAQIIAQLKFPFEKILLIEAKFT
ncbi:MAG: class I SAM-dependent methyltransferase [Candidatus Bathyarchaeota archaeon]